VKPIALPLVVIIICVVEVAGDGGETRKVEISKVELLAVTRRSGITD
jgi:hypothetical protein